MSAPRSLDEVPGALGRFHDVRGLLWNRYLVVFLDFDGTLSPIVDDPAAAAPSERARRAVEGLAAHWPVVVISGRELDDVRDRLGIDGLWYAGSHGLEISGPAGEHHVQGDALESSGSLDTVASAIADRLEGIDGVRVEHKRFSLSVHYRSVETDDVSTVTATVEEVTAGHDDLRITEGRRLREVRPAIDWDKGTALTWLLERIAPSKTPFPIYAGDDITDEDALEAVRDIGLGVVVRSAERDDAPTFAHVAVVGPDQLAELLDRITALADERRLETT